MYFQNAFLAIMNPSLVFTFMYCRYKIITNRNNQQYRYYNEQSHRFYYWQS